MSHFKYPRPPRGLVTVNTTGARGERRIVQVHPHRVKRPNGHGLQFLLNAMADIGYPDIPPTGFDAVDIPQEAHEGGFTFSSNRMVREWCEHFRFVEVKTCTQERADDGFGRFLFGFPYAEIRAAEILGDRYIVVLYNSLTGQIRESSLPDLLGRASSKAWQLTVQLAPTEVVWEGHDVLDLFGGPPPELDVFDLF